MNRPTQQATATAPDDTASGAGYGRMPRQAATSWAVDSPEAAPDGQRRPRTVLGLLAAVVAMAVAALAYGGLLRATMAADGAYHEFSFAALGVGLAVGAAAGLAGRGGRLLPVGAAVLSLLGVALGELCGLALVSAHSNAIPVTDVVTLYHAALLHDWRRQLDVMSGVFLFLAAVEGFLITRRFGRRP